MSNLSGEVDLIGNPLSSPVVDAESTSPEVQVEVVDDRPEEDRVGGRDPSIPSDDEIIGDLPTGSRAQKRIQQLRYE